MRLAYPPSHAVAASLLAVSLSTQAAPPELRPLDEEAVRAIGQDLWKIDASALSPRRWMDALNNAAVTPTSLRLGLGDAVELQAQANGRPQDLGLETVFDNVNRLQGFTDVSFGAKWRVRGGDAGWLPGVAWLADVETATGAPAFRGRDFRPSLRATAEWELPGKLSLGMMPGIYRDRDDFGKHYVAGVMAVTLGKAWTPRLHSFIELAGERIAQPQHDGSLVNLDTGMAFAASKSVQFAAVVSRSLVTAAPQMRAGLSVSARY